MGTFATGCSSSLLSAPTLQNFDAALVIYMFAVIFTTWEWRNTTTCGCRTATTALAAHLAAIAKTGVRGVGLVIHRTATDLTANIHPKALAESAG